MISENYYVIYEAYQGWNKEIIHCLTYGDVTGGKKGNLFIYKCNDSYSIVLDEYSFGNRYFFTYMQWYSEKQIQKLIFACSGQISQIWNEVEEAVGEEEQGQMKYCLFHFNLCIQVIRS